MYKTILSMCNVKCICEFLTFKYCVGIHHIGNMLLSQSIMDFNHNILYNRKL